MRAQSQRVMAGFPSVLLVRTELESLNAANDGLYCVLDQVSLPRSRRRSLSWWCGIVKTDNRNAAVKLLLRQVAYPQQFGNCVTQSHPDGAAVLPCSLLFISSYNKSTSAQQASIAGSEEQPRERHARLHLLLLRRKIVSIRP